MIVAMRHLDLVCLASERDATLTALRDIGAVHLDLAAASGAAVAAAKGDGEAAEKAVRLILRSRGKTPAGEFEIRERSVAEVLALEADRLTLIEERDRLEREIKRYAAYGDFDPELAKKVLAGMEARGLGDVFKAVVTLPAGLPEMRLAKLQEKYERVVNRVKIDDVKLASCDERAVLRRYPALRDRVAFESARELMGERGALAFVSGWLPVTEEEGLRRAAADRGWAVLLREPAEGEAPPTLIEPPKLFRPMKSLFAGLGISPAYTEADVSVPFMCYFTLFFAMLVGDGAYGAIFLIITLLMRKKLPRSWFILLTVFSAATVGWGFLSNTWFGAGLPFAADWPTVKWLADPSYKNIMLLCFTIGVSHLMLARIWNGVCRLPDSTALAEFGWAGVLLFMYFVTNSLVGIFASIPSVMMGVFGVSLALVFLFSVKPSQLKTNGITLGMLPLNIMSALGDIISYVRLFAVGLASAKVAANFNAMAVGLVSSENALWLNAVMSVLMVLILVAGHGLNLAMAALSILVHAVRLNTLEFSNHKGVSWSGYSFNPFKKEK